MTQRLTKWWGPPFLLLLSVSAQAFDRTKLYADAGGEWGYTASTGTSAAASPTLLQLGLGASAGYTVYQRFFAGVGVSYQRISQFSDPDLYTGSRKGSRLLVDPLIGLKLEEWVFKAGVEFIGNYSLSEADPSGNNISYTSPFGFKLEALYALTEKIYLGGVFETVSFSNQHSDGSGLGGVSDTALGKNLSLTQFGLTLAYLF